MGQGTGARRQGTALVCTVCSARFTAAHRSRRLCDACTGRQANLTARRVQRRLAAGVPRVTRRRGRHTVTITCKRCGARENREYSTIRPKFCWACRGAMVREQRREDARRAYHRGRE